MSKYKSQVISSIRSAAARGGWTNEGTAALLGMTKYESSYNPYVVGDYGKSFGLFQVANRFGTQSGKESRRDRFVQILKQKTGHPDPLKHIDDVYNNRAKEDPKFTQALIDASIEHFVYNDIDKSINNKNVQAALKSTDVNTASQLLAKATRFGEWNRMKTNSPNYQKRVAQSQVHLKELQQNPIDPQKEQQAETQQAQTQQNQQQQSTTGNQQQRKDVENVPEKYRPTISRLLENPNYKNVSAQTAYKIVEETAKKYGLSVERVSDLAATQVTDEQRRLERAFGITSSSQSQGTSQQSGVSRLPPLQEKALADLNRARDQRITGTLSVPQLLDPETGKMVDVTPFQFGSGGTKASIPYGIHDLSGLRQSGPVITQFAGAQKVVHVGGQQSGYQNIYDPKLQRNRTAIQIHSTGDLNRLVSSGCIVIPKKGGEYQRFINTYSKLIKQYGKLYLYAQPSPSGQPHQFSILTQAQYDELKKSSDVNVTAVDSTQAAANFNQSGNVDGTSDPTQSDQNVRKDVSRVTELRSSLSPNQRAKFDEYLSNRNMTDISAEEGEKIIADAYEFVSGNKPPPPQQQISNNLPTDLDQIPDDIRNLRIKDTDGKTKTLAEMGITHFSQLSEGKGIGGQAFKGGRFGHFNDPNVTFMAGKIQGILGDKFDRLTAQNDAFHHGSYADKYKSGHLKGTKLDFTIKGDKKEYQKQIAILVKEFKDKYGLVEGTHYKIHRNIDHGTGRHVDIGFTPEGTRAVLENRQRELAAQGPKTQEQQTQPSAQQRQGPIDDWLLTTGVGSRNNSVENQRRTISSIVPNAKVVGMNDTSDIADHLIKGGKVNLFSGAANKSNVDNLIAILKAKYKDDQKVKDVMKRVYISEPYGNSLLPLLGKWIDPTQVVVHESDSNRGALLRKHNGDVKIGNSKWNHNQFAVPQIVRDQAAQDQAAQDQAAQDQAPQGADLTTEYLVEIADPNYSERGAIISRKAAQAELDRRRNQVLRENNLPADTPTNWYRNSLEIPSAGKSITVPIPASSVSAPPLPTAPVTPMGLADEAAAAAKAPPQQFEDVTGDYLFRETEEKLPSSSSSVAQVSLSAPPPGSTPVPPSVIREGDRTMAGFSTEQELPPTPQDRGPVMPVAPASSSASSPPPPPPTAPVTPMGLADEAAAAAKATTPMGLADEAAAAAAVTPPPRSPSAREAQNTSMEKFEQQKTELQAGAAVRARLDAAASAGGDTGGGGGEGGAAGSGGGASNSADHQPASSGSTGQSASDESLCWV